MGTINQKIEYLGETKSLLKEAINNLGGEIDNNTTFREYVEELQDIYDNLPKTSYGEGTNISLANTNKGKLDFYKEYQQVEYIQVTGTYTIDTEIIPTNTTGIYQKFARTGQTDDSLVCGVRESSDSNTRFFGGTSYNNNVAFGWKLYYRLETTGDINMGVPSSPATLDNNEIAEFYMNYNNSRKVRYVNKTKNYDITSTSSLDEFSTTFTKSIYMFGYNKAGTANGCQCKIYELKISQGTNLVAHFIPCYRKSDNTIGMYDIVRNRFFTGTGTGSFSKGADVGTGFNDNLLYGDTTQNTLTGKNLFNPVTSINGTNIALRNLTFSTDLSTGEITITSLASGEIWFGNVVTTNNPYNDTTGWLMEVEPNTSYTFQPINNVINRVVWTEFDENKISLGYRDVGNTITTKSNAKYLLARIGLQNITPNTIYKDKIQIRKTSTSSDFELYCGGIPSPNPNYPQDIQVVTGTQGIEIRGKNLFDKSNITSGYRITNQGELVQQTGYYSSDFIKVIPSTKYTKNSPTADGYHKFAFYSTNQESSFISYSNTNTSTTPENCYYIRFCGLSTELDTTQLEVGTSATTYSPYTSQTDTLHLGDLELAKIGSYQDKIYYDNGKWYKYSAIGKKTFNGTEYWGQYVNDNLGFHYSGLATEFKYNFYQGYCNYFTFQNNNSAWTSHGKCGIASSRVFWLLHTDSNINTVDKFKNWLSEHNMIIRYVLDTPSTTEITNETLLSDLEYIRTHAMSYSGTTNITVSGDLPLILKVRVLKGE